MNWFSSPPTGNLKNDKWLSNINTYFLSPATSKGCKASPALENPHSPAHTSKPSVDRTQYLPTQSTHRESRANNRK